MRTEENQADTTEWFIALLNMFRALICPSSGAGDYTCRVWHDHFQMTDCTHKMKNQTVLHPSLYTVQVEMSIFITLLITVSKFKFWDVTLIW